MIKNIILLVLLLASSLEAQTNGLVFGQEYLSKFHRTIISGAIPKVVFSGDSTTEGAGLTNFANTIPNAFRAAIIQSITDVQAINAGHSGMTIHQWITNYINLDMALVPDLYVLRWGLNPNVGSSFEFDLRKGLTEIRSKYSVEMMSIVLMTPNCCNDTPYGRDMKYLESINPVVRKAARDFKCVFIDLTYTYPDAFSDSMLMDDPFGDGRRIHPNDMFNHMIASLIVDTVLPKSIANFCPPRLSIQRKDGVDIVVQSGNAMCVVEKSFDMRNWFPVDVVVNGNSVHYRSGLVETNCFYRVRR